MEQTQDGIVQHLDDIRKENLALLEKHKAEWKAHYEELKNKGADVADIKLQLERAIRRIDESEALLKAPVGTPGSPYQEKTLGQMLVENPAVQELAKKMMPGGSGWIAGTRASVPLNSFFINPGFFDPMEMKTTITSSAVGSSTPGILVPQRIPGIVKPGVRQLRVRDLLPRIPTTNNAVEWVKENVFTNAASPTAETISKPESALTFTIDSIPVRTIAHVIPIARQVLDDFTSLQAYVDMRLLEGLKDVEDYELIAGDGTGQHLSGLSTEATAYDTARNVSGDTKLDVLNHAISQIEDVHLVADAIFLHPSDWRKIQLIKTEEGGANKGMYLLGGPGNAAMPNIWSLPVATTTAVTAGTFYVGAFQLNTSVIDRMTARVDISTEHMDFFQRNMILVRAEERIALAVTRADAIVYGTLPATTVA